MEANPLNFVPPEAAIWVRLAKTCRGKLLGKSFRIDPIIPKVCKNFLQEWGNKCGYPSRGYQIFDTTQWLAHRSYPIFGAISAWLINDHLPKKPASFGLQNSSTEPLNLYLTQKRIAHIFPHLKQNKSSTDHPQIIHISSIFLKHFHE